MKILSSLTAVATEAPWTEPRGILRTIHDEPTPGFFRRVTLGEGGIVVRRGEHAVGVPLAALLQLAEQFEQNLIPPTLVAKSAGEKSPVQQVASKFKAPSNSEPA